MIEDEKVPKDMLDLAIHIVDSKTGTFEPEKFEDEYETALKELLRGTPSEVRRLRSFGSDTKIILTLQRL